MMFGALAVAIYHWMDPPKHAKQLVDSEDQSSEDLTVQVTGDSAWARVQNCIKRHKGVAIALVSIVVAVFGIALCSKNLWFYYLFYYQDEI